MQFPSFWHQFLWTKQHGVGSYRLNSMVYAIFFFWHQFLWTKQHGMGSYGQNGRVFPWQMSCKWQISCRFTASLQRLLPTTTEQTENTQARKRVEKNPTSFYEGMTYERPPRMSNNTISMAPNSILLSLRRSWKNNVSMWHRQVKDQWPRFCILFPKTENTNE